MELDRKLISKLCGAVAEQKDAEILLLWDNFLSKIERNWFLEVGVKWGGTSKIWEVCGFKNGIGIDMDIYNFEIDSILKYVIDISKYNNIIIQSE